MPDPPPVHTSRTVRQLYILAGLLFVGIAYLGVLLPGLPATPWLILASFCFARSSPWLQRWLHRAPLVGPVLQDWEKYRGIRRRVKVFAVCIVCAALVYSVGFAPIPDWGRVAIAACGLVGIGVILFVVPTVREPKT